jgi:aminoglycoside phosphotransferase (APT) family kinase protein
MEEKLGKFLAQQLPQAEELSVTAPQRLVGGFSREHWGFEAQWQEDGSPVRRELVLNRFAPGGPVETDMEKEYRVLRCLEGSGVPAPRTYGLDRDGRYFGSPSFVVEKREGSTIEPLRLMRKIHPHTRQALGRQFVDILAHIHRLDWKGKGLSFLEEPGEDSPAASELAYWEGILERHTLEPEPVLVEALRWLKSHMPPALRVTLVHGDYRLENCLHQNSKITAILDWELAHLGDPLEDVAWACLDAFAVDGRVCGLMERMEFLELYQELSGIPVREENICFYEVFGCVKLIAIFQTWIHGFCQGQSRDLTAASVRIDVTPVLLKSIVDLIGL